MDSFNDFAEMVVRICKHPDTDCMHCPLADDFGCTHGYILADILKKKKAIAKWLKEHRETSLSELGRMAKQSEEFPDSNTNILPCWYLPKDLVMCNTFDGCSKCRSRSIPAEIAEKLGIKPITQGEAGRK